jgi:hypothetical protein
MIAMKFAESFTTKVTFVCTPAKTAHAFALVNTH